jgi:hypothetical protein
METNHFGENPSRTPKGVPYSMEAIVIIGQAKNAE